jgi:hypothetical protein
VKLGHKRIILDYHFSSFLPQTLTQVDPEAYVRQMKAAGIEAFLVYAKDHWGNVYHKSHISPKHPNAPADLFGTLLRLCRENGITPYAYTTIQWDEHSARTHPEWRAKDGCGQLISGKDAGWNFLCINTPYRDYFLRQIEELAAGYDFPALFMDILAYGPSGLICHCDYCKSLWRATYRQDMPAAMGLGDRIRYAAFRDAICESLYRDVRAILARHGKSDCMVTHNCGGNNPQLPNFIAKETEPFGLDYIIPQILCKETRNRAAGREAEIYFGRFNRFWDFTVKSPSLLRWEVINAFAHDCAATIIDQPLLDGQLDPAAYQAIGFAYEHGQRLLQFTRGSTPYTELAVYYDHLNYEANNGDGHEDFVGACKVLAETHFPYDLLTEFDARAALDPYSAIVVPCTPLMNATMQSAIRRYVENGGTVICSDVAGEWDEQGNPSANRHFLIDVGYTWPTNANFIRPRVHPEGMYERVGAMMQIELVAGDVVLGTVQPGALERNTWQWVSHNTPPGLPTDSAAVVIRRVGKGRVLYFNTAIFAEYLRTNLLSLRQFIQSCLKEVYQPKLWIKAPSIVDAVFQRKGDQWIVALNCCTLDRGGNSSSMYYGTKPPLYMNINETFAIAGIEVLSTRPVTSAILLDGARCAVNSQDGVWRVALPPIEGYEAVALTLAAR